MKADEEMHHRHPNGLFNYSEYVGSETRLDRLPAEQATDDDDDTATSSSTLTRMKCMAVKRVEAIQLATKKAMILDKEPGTTLTKCVVAKPMTRSRRENPTTFLE